MNIQLDYYGAREIARKACLRAACFLGFGINSARDGRLQDFSLSKVMNLQFLPPDLPASKVEEFKGEYEKWIVANGLRELIEGFAVFLDRLFEYSLIASQNGKTLDPDSLKRIQAVRNKGLPGKQHALRTDFAIQSELASHLKSIYEARNCMSHTRGIVTRNFTNDGDTLLVTWRAIEILLVRPSGEEQFLEFKQDAELVEGPGNLVRRSVTRERRFSLDQPITFDGKDLAEVCLFGHMACESFFASALDFAKQNGVIPEN